MPRSERPAGTPPDPWSGRHVLASLRRPDTYTAIGECDVLLARHDGDCAHTVGGKAYAQLIDSVGELCQAQGMRIGAVAVPYSVLTGDLAHNDPVSFNRAAFVDGRIGRAAAWLRDGRRGHERILERRERIWARILDRARPSHVIGIEPDAALCRVGRSRGVRVFDLQHGLVLDELPRYGADHQERTPTADLPAGYLCWDEPSAATLRKWAPARGIDVRVVGNPWFSRFAYPRAGDPLVAAVGVPLGMIHDASRPTVVVSLQWGMTQEYSYEGFNGVMAATLEQAILRTAGTYNWLLRLHPLQRLGGERQRTLAYLEGTFGHLDAVEWAHCSELPLPTVLQHADVHVTDSSTTFVEASWLGVRSALLSVHIGPGRRWASLDVEALSSGLAEIVPHDVEALESWIAAGVAAGRDGRAAARQEGAYRALGHFIAEIAADAALSR